MKLDKYLRLSWKRGLIIAGAWVLSALLHKAIYYFAIKVDLATDVLFILGTVAIPVYLIISLVYTLIRKMGYQKFLLLSWRTVLIIPAWLLSVLLHGVNYALFYEHYWPHGPGGPDEAVFFFVALLVIPLYFIVSVVYTVIRLVRSGIS